MTHAPASHVPAGPRAIGAAVSGFVTILGVLALAAGISASLGLEVRRV